jgi:hypothetical protein
MKSSLCIATIHRASILSHSWVGSTLRIEEFD